MTAQRTIVEKWIAETMASYPPASVPFLAGESDPFRNPVGHAVRQSLTTMFEQLVGDMNRESLDSALDGIIRVRAVQDLSPTEAIGFVFRLKAILRELAPEEDQIALADRVDRLALMAFDKYTQCREQLAEIRIKEWRRGFGSRQASG
jgi:hypothetical protein